jgi:hypothetical protein
MIVIGKTVYIKPSVAFWRQQLPSSKADAVIELVKGKWIKAATSDREWRLFAAFADQDGFVTELFKNVKTAKLKKKGPKMIGGVRCIGSMTVMASCG